MEFDNNKPIFLQIVDKMISMVLQEKWQEGKRIPSVRDLAISLEVNPNTAIRAFNHLQDLGIIYNKRGVGYFVEEKGKGRAKLFQKEEFLKEDLPKVFSKMEVLGISVDEITILFHKHINQRNETI